MRLILWSGRLSTEIELGVSISICSLFFLHAVVPGFVPTVPQTNVMTIRKLGRRAGAQTKGSGAGLFLTHR